MMEVVEGDTSTREDGRRVHRSSEEAGRQGATHSCCAVSWNLKQWTDLLLLSPDPPVECLWSRHTARSQETHSPEVGKVFCVPAERSHHISICLRGRGTQARQSGTHTTAQTRMDLSATVTAQTRADSPTVPRPGLDPKAPVYQSQNPRTASLWVNSNRTVLLQTAQALAFNPDAPQLSRQVRIVLDTGSQRSYVTERVTKELSLTAKGEQPMTIMTFGSTEERPQTCQFVTVGLALNGGRTKHLTLVTVPLICEPLNCQPVSFSQENFEHLAGLNLADSSDGRSRLEIDILIGSDRYWELITGEIRQWSSGPVAIHTELGWVLSGPAASPT